MKHKHLFIKNKTHSENESAFSKLSSIS